MSVNADIGDVGTTTIAIAVATTRSTPAAPTTALGTVTMAPTRAAVEFGNSSNVSLIVDLSMAAHGTSSARGRSAPSPQSP
jgi:hypothetical protein